MTEQAHSDERELLNQLARFARILDSRDWDNADSVFAGDITFDYGDGVEQVGLAALKITFQQFLDPCGPSQHLLGSILLTIDGDTATSHTYVQARHQGAGDKAHLFLDTNGEYVDQWQRRPEGWRMTRRDARWMIMQGDPAVLMAE